MFRIIISMSVVAGVLNSLYVQPVEQDPMRNNAHPCTVGASKSHTGSTATFTCSRNQLLLVLEADLMASYHTSMTRMKRERSMWSRQVEEAV